MTEKNGFKLNLAHELELPCAAVGKFDIRYLVMSE